jgi:hypothetical protein
MNTIIIWISCNVSEAVVLIVLTMDGGIIMTKKKGKEKKISGHQSYAWA